MPNLAVEFVGRTTGAEDLVEKIGEYFAAGVQVVWVIYPRARLVYAYESAEKARILTERQALDGGRVLPTFRLGVANLFDLPFQHSCNAWCG